MKMEQTTEKRQLLEVKDALRIWTEEFMKDNETQKEESVVIRDVMGFNNADDPTSDYFLGFEAKITEGKKKGLLVSVILLNQTEEELRKTWSERNKFIEISDDMISANKEQMIEAEHVTENYQDEYKLVCPHCGNVQQWSIDMSNIENRKLQGEDALHCPRCSKDLGVMIESRVFTSS